MYEDGAAARAAGEIPPASACSSALSVSAMVAGSWIASQPPLNQIEAAAWNVRDIRHVVKREGTIIEP